MILEIASKKPCGRFIDWRSNIVFHGRRVASPDLMRYFAREMYSRSMGGRWVRRRRDRAVVRHFVSRGVGRERESKQRRSQKPLHKTLRRFRFDSNDGRRSSSSTNRSPEQRTLRATESIPGSLRRRNQKSLSPMGSSLSPRQVPVSSDEGGS